MVILIREFIMNKNEMLLQMAIKKINGEPKSQITSDFYLDIENLYGVKSPDWNSDENDQILEAKQNKWDKTLEKIESDIIKLLKQIVEKESDGEKSLTEIEREEKALKRKFIVSENKKFVEKYKDFIGKKVEIVTKTGKNFFGILSLHATGFCSIYHPIKIESEDFTQFESIQEFTTTNKNMWKSGSKKCLMISIDETKEINCLKQE